MTEDRYRTTVVCVDACEDGIMAGRLLNPYQREAIPFYGIMQFLLQMEKLLDEMHVPQPFSQTRQFSAVTQQETRLDMEHIAPEGKIATFAIKVIFRQNASWQGSVTWLNERREESFRSVFELLFLLDSAQKSKQQEIDTAV